MEFSTSNSNINTIKETKKLFNDVRSRLSREETKRISYFFKEKEQEGSSTKRQKNVIKNIDRYLKNISKHLKNLKKHF